jgi:uncharacterized protein
MGQEIRTLSTEIEIREMQEEQKKTITGYAVKWNQWSSQIAGFFQERFERGAFSESLKSDVQKSLWCHDRRQVLASTKNGTLRLQEDDIGLRFEADLPNNSWGNDAYISIKRGDVDGVSFGFKTKPKGDVWDEDDPKIVKRTVSNAILFEVSPEPFPAYPQSEVQARSIDEAYKEYRAVKEESVPEAEADKLAEQRKGFNKLKSKIYQAYEEVK